MPLACRGGRSRGRHRLRPGAAIRPAPRGITTHPGGDSDSFPGVPRGRVPRDPPGPRGGHPAGAAPSSRTIFPARPLRPDPHGWAGLPPPRGRDPADLRLRPPRLPAHDPQPGLTADLYRPLPDFRPRPATHGSRAGEIRDPRPVPPHVPHPWHEHLVQVVRLRAAGRHLRLRPDRQHGRLRHLDDPRSAGARPEHGTHAALHAARVRHRNAEGKHAVADQDPHRARLLQRQHLRRVGTSRCGCVSPGSTSARS